MTHYDKIIYYLKNNRSVAIIILISTVVISISAFTDAVTKMGSILSPLASLFKPNPIDVNGVWLSEKSDELGSIFFHFDTQEDRLFGMTIQSASSKWPNATNNIQDGKIDGNRISFLVARSFVKQDPKYNSQSGQWTSPAFNEVIYKFEGKLKKGNTIHFTRTTKTGYVKLDAKRIIDRTKVGFDKSQIGIDVKSHSVPYSFVYSLSGHKGGVKSLAFCPEGKYPITLATGGVELVSGGAEDGKIKYWDTATAENRGEVVLSDRGEVHVACTRRTNTALNILAKEILAVNGEKGERSVIAREMTEFASHSHASQRQSELSGALISIAISGKNARLFSTSEINDIGSHALRLRYSSGEIVRTLKEDSFIGPMAMSLDSTVLSVVSRNMTGDFVVETRYFERAAEVGLWQIPAASFSPIALALDPDGYWLAVSSKESGEVTIWDLRSQTPIQRLTSIEDGTLCCLTFTNGGKFLVAAETEWGNLSIWRVSNGELYQTIENEGPVDSIAISQDARLIAAGDKSTGQIHLWAKVVDTP